MRTIVDWLDDAKKVTGSDYRTAEELGISRQSISQFRSGKHIPSTKMCAKLAEFLDVSPLHIIASCEVQKDPAEEKRWVKWMGAAAILAGVIMIDSSFNSKAYASELMETPYTLCAVAVGALILFVVYTQWLKRYGKG